MKLRKAWFLLAILLLASAARANPVTPVSTGVKGTSYGFSYISINYDPKDGNRITFLCGDVASKMNLAPTWQASISGVPLTSRSGAVRLTGSVQEFSTLIAVPEPTSLALFGTGLLGVATLVRRQARRKAGK